MVKIALPLLILLMPGLSATQEDQGRQSASLIVRAAQLLDIRTRRSDPFILQASIRVLGLEGGDKEGTYSLAWQSPRTWRAQLDFAPNYQDVEIANDGKQWHGSTENQASVRLLQLRYLLDFAARLRRRSTETITGQREESLNGVVLRCVSVEDGQAHAHELCFDSEGALVQERDENILNEYTDFVQFGEKTFPQTMRAFEGDDFDKQVIEVRVETLESSNPDQAWFELPPGAEWLYMGRAEGVTQPRLIDQVLPEYTPAATRAGVEGVVYLQAVITKEGRVANPALIKGLPDWELNRRAIEALVKWRFEPAMKDGQPVSMIALISVEYRIRAREGPGT